MPRKCIEGSLPSITIVSSWRIVRNCYRPMTYSHNPYVFLVERRNYLPLCDLSLDELLDRVLGLYVFWTLSIVN